MDYYADKSVLVLGGNGFLGKHLVRELYNRNVYEVAHPTHKELEILDWQGLQKFVLDMSPDIIFHLAARVGGIHYNISHQADLIHENGLMAINVVRAAYLADAKLVAAGSVCSYPEYVPVPTIERNLYSGSPEPSNLSYGVSKRFLLELQRAYYSQHDLIGAHLVSANLYGKEDNFDPASSHVIPALIVKIQEAIDNDAGHFVVWGTGRASRDMLYVEDAADAYLAAGEYIDYPEPVNIASGEETPIHFLVTRLADIMGFDGDVLYDKSKPDGQNRRLFQINRMIELTGWEPKIGLDEGLRRTVDYYHGEIHNH